MRATQQSRNSILLLLAGGAHQLTERCCTPNCHQPPRISDNSRSIWSKRGPKSAGGSTSPSTLLLLSADKLLCSTDPVNNFRQLIRLRYQEPSMCAQELSRNRTKGTLGDSGRLRESERSGRNPIKFFHGIRWPHPHRFPQSVGARPGLLYIEPSTLYKCKYVCRGVEGPIASTAAFLNVFIHEHIMGLRRPLRTPSAIQ